MDSSMLNEIFERLKIYFNVKTNKELAVAMRQNESTLNTWKNRNSIPYEKLFEISQREHLSLDWILTGVKSDNNVQHNKELESSPLKQEILLLMEYAPEKMLLKIRDRLNEIKKITEGI